MKNLRWTIIIIDEKIEVSWGFYNISYSSFECSGLPILQDWCFSSFFLSQVLESIFVNKADEFRELTNPKITGILEKNNKENNCGLLRKCEHMGNLINLINGSPGDYVGNCLNNAGMMMQLPSLESDDSRLGFAIKVFKSTGQSVYIFFFLFCRYVNNISGYFGFKSPWELVNSE